MSPNMLSRLQAADYAIDVALRAKRTPSNVIAMLVRDHRANFTPGASTNTLRVAGVTATCTWSKDQGLLDAWRRRATEALARERAA